MEYALRFTLHVSPQGTYGLRFTSSRGYMSGITSSLGSFV